jgi:hypothetical protein
VVLTDAHDYLMPELAADMTSGHNIVATVRAYRMKDV